VDQFGYALEPTVNPLDFIGLGNGGGENPEEEHISDDDLFGFEF